MKNNIGIFSTHALWPSHFETELEIIQSEIDRGSNVYVFNCDKAIDRCEVIWNRSQRVGKNIEELRQRTCNICQHKQDTGYGLIKGFFSKQSLIIPSQKDRQYQLDPFYLKDTANLKKLIVDDYYYAGWSMLSTLISCVKDPFVDVNLYQQQLNKLFEDCCRIYYSAKDYIAKYQLTKVYVFNGRLSYTKAITDAAKAMGIDFYIHERGSDFTKYELFKNHTPHVISKIAERINLAWESEKDINVKEEIGKQFYLDRTKNVFRSWSSFLDLQDPTLLPSNWDDSKHNIGVFTSSEDEFASISSEWDNPYFNTQLEGLHYIANVVSKQSNMHMYVRVHPNSKKMPRSYVESLYELNKISNITLIDFDSNISSYQLLKSCNKIITFGSTIGIEAVFWQKPSILLAKSFYFNLKGLYKPDDVTKIKDLVLNTELLPQIENDAIKYGYYTNSYGIKFKYYIPIDYQSGSFKGVDLNNIPRKEFIHPTFLSRVKNKLKKMLGSK